MITHPEFVAAARELEQLGLGWNWIDRSKQPAGSSLGDEGYLERMLLAPILPDCLPNTQASAAASAAASNGGGARDPPAGEAPPLASWAIHACYSYTYGEPVLYFQAAELSGTPLGADAVLAHLAAELAAGGAAEPTPDGLGLQVQRGVPAVTQELHPILRRPFFLVHPCRTGEVMAALGGGGGGGMPPLRYLLAWLRVTAGPLGAAPTPEEWRDALGSGS